LSNADKGAVGLILALELASLTLYEIFLVLFLYSKQELEEHFGAKQVLHIVVLAPQLS